MELIRKNIHMNREKCRSGLQLTLDISCILHPIIRENMMRLELYMDTKNQ